MYDDWGPGFMCGMLVMFIIMLTAGFGVDEHRKSYINDNICERLYSGTNQYLQCTKNDLWKTIKLIKRID